MRKLTLLFAFFVASATFAAPVITSVVPNEGPATGGTVVRINGSGFSQICIVCSPSFKAAPLVHFGGNMAASVKFIDEHTLEAVTPASLPGPTWVMVEQFDGNGSVLVQNAFTFTGEVEEAYDPILFPVFLRPTDGAFGSRFETTAHVWNKGISSVITLFGMDTSCYLFSPIRGPEMAFPLGPTDVPQTLLTGCSQSVGRVFWVSKNHDDLAASLRVRDVTREASSLGVEVPVVTRERFSTRIALPNVPVDPRYRHTLRIYSLRNEPVQVTVNVNGFVHRPHLTLTPGNDIFEPSYAELSDFPILPGQTSMRVTVHSEHPVWALMSVTNNETQAITTVSPQP